MPPVAVEHRVDHSRAPLLPRCWLPEMLLQRDAPCGAVRATSQSTETECVARAIMRTEIDLICFREKNKKKLKSTKHDVNVVF
jgi:hypothetical protein